MEKVNACNCPYVDWCEIGRQRLQEFFRQEGDTEECLFKPLIKQLIEIEDNDLNMYFIKRKEFGGCFLIHLEQEKHYCKLESTLKK